MNPNHPSKQEVARRLNGILGRADTRKSVFEIRQRDQTVIALVDVVLTGPAGPPDILIYRNRPYHHVASGSRTTYIESTVFCVPDPNEPISLPPITNDGTDNQSSAAEPRTTGDTHHGRGEIRDDGGNPPGA